MGRSLDRTGGRPAARTSRFDPVARGKMTCRLSKCTLHGAVSPSLPTHVSGRSILRWQAIGFSSLVAIMWLVEVFRLPHYFFNESPEFLWTRALLRSLTVACVWAIVHWYTSRLLQRLHELEEFLLICAWCRKVGHNDEWLSMEDYFDSKFATGTSHGICPDCVAKQLAEHRRRTCEAVEKVETKH